jgi:hypothetical protein
MLFQQCDNCILHTQCFKHKQIHTIATCSSLTVACREEHTAVKWRWLKAFFYDHYCNWFTLILSQAHSHKFVMHGMSSMVITTSTYTDIIHPDSPIICEVQTLPGWIMPLPRPLIMWWINEPKIVYPTKLDNRSIL